MLNLDFHNKIFKNVTYQAHHVINIIAYTKNMAKSVSSNIITSSNNNYIKFEVH